MFDGSPPPEILSAWHTANLLSQREFKVASCESTPSYALMKALDYLMIFVDSTCLFFQFLKEVDVFDKDLALRMYTDYESSFDPDGRPWSKSLRF